MSRLESLGWLMPEVWAHGELWHFQPDDDVSASVEVGGDPDPMDEGEDEVTINCL